MKREEKLRERFKEMRAFEDELFRKGTEYIGGVDEVGRGPLAGPVTAACVILPKDFDVLGIDDSKKLSPKKREELSEIIKEKALAWATASVDEKTIDDINILEATKEAMKEAVRKADKNLAQKLREADEKSADRGISSIEHLLIDAVDLKTDIPVTAITKGDSKSLSIAAASIIAKVERDNLMAKYDKIYPGYEFASNKGYGTKAHYAGLKTRGPCPIHRMTFLKNLSSH